MTQQTAPGVKGQSKSDSFIEACSNTFVGLLIAFWAMQLICYLSNIPMSYSDNAIITFWMTVISVARNYWMRRFYNSDFYKRIKGYFRRRKIERYIKSFGPCTPEEIPEIYLPPGVYTKKQLGEVITQTYNIIDEDCCCNDKH